MSNSSDPQVFLTEAYRGEVMGCALFARMAELEHEASRVARWWRLEHLETHVKTQLRAELERLDLPVAGDPAAIVEGRDEAANLSVLDRDAARLALAESLRRHVQELRVSTKGLPAELADIGRLVLRHEEALLAEFDSERREDDAIDHFLSESAAPDERPIPEGLRITPLDEIYQADPAAVHSELQRRAPIHRDRVLGGLIVSGHDVVHRIAYDLEFFVDPRKAREDDPVRQFMTEDRDQEPSMLFLDDPQHTRLRNLVSRSFTPRAVRLLHPVIELVAQELLDAIESDALVEFDLIERLAAPLPAIAIARILGVDPSQQAQFKTWSVASSEAFFNPFADDETKQRGQDGQAALEACFREEIAKRNERPADDLIGKLVAAEREGDRLSEGELVTMCGLLLVAGNVTTTDLIGNGMHALLERPEQHAKLRASPELTANAVEEMLRFDPPVQSTGRIAPRDGDIGGVPIRKGESINVLLAAANRDPAVYPEPDRFDIERADTHHHAFGGGAHLCLGAHLARAEARVAIRSLVARFPKLRPAGRPLTWKKTPGFRGLQDYWVRID